MAKLTQQIAGMFSNQAKNSTPTIPIQYQNIFRTEFLNYSLRNFYKRIFRDSLLLNFKGKEHFELGLFGVAKQKDSVYIWNVLDIIVLNAIGSNSRTEYYPIGINDDLSKPLPAGIKGKFCGFIQNAPATSKRQSILPDFNLDWNIGLRAILLMNTEFLNSMRTLMVANQTPIFKIDPSQLTGNFEIVKEEVKKEIQSILKAWESLDKQEAIFMPSGSSLEFPQINFDSFNNIQTIIAQEQSKITGLTITYLLGKQPQGLNATGDNDHLQNIKMFKVYGKQYIIPLLQQIVPFLDISLTEKSKLLDINYFKTIEELDIAFNYLDKLSTIDIYLQGEEKEKMKSIILSLFD